MRLAVSSFRIPGIAVKNLSILTSDNRRNVNCYDFDTVGRCPWRLCRLKIDGFLIDGLSTVKASPCVKSLSDVCLDVVEWVEVHQSFTFGTFHCLFLHLWAVPLSSGAALFCLIYIYARNSNKDDYIYLIPLIWCGWQDLTNPLNWVMSPLRGPSST